MAEYELFPFEVSIDTIGLYNASHYHLPDNFTWSGESHDSWELVYVDQGKVIVTVGTERCILKSGELVLHCPNEFHNLASYESSSANVIIISFACSSEALNCLGHRILTLGKTEKQYLTSIVSESEATFRFFNQAPPAVLMQQKEDTPLGSLQIIKNLLECFLLLILRHQSSICFDDRAIPIHQINHHERIAQQIKDYIRSHYREKLTVSRLAVECGMSVTQTKRIFREQTGSTMIAFLIRYRMEEAKRLIQDGSYTFSQIASMVGYENIYYFSSAFKKEMKMTLTEYANSVYHVSSGHC